jgi:hypothetical protein
MRTGMHGRGAGRPSSSVGRLSVSAVAGLPVKWSAPNVDISAKDIQVRFRSAWWPRDPGYPYDRRCPPGGAFVRVNTYDRVFHGWIPRTDN